MHRVKSTACEPPVSTIIGALEHLAGWASTPRPYAAHAKNNSRVLVKTVFHRWHRGCRWDLAERHTGAEPVTRKILGSGDGGRSFGEGAGERISAFVRIEFRCGTERFSGLSKDASRRSAGKSVRSGQLFV